MFKFILTIWEPIFKNIKKARKLQTFTQFLTTFIGVVPQTMLPELSAYVRIRCSIINTVLHSYAML